MKSQIQSSSLVRALMGINLFCVFALPCTARDWYVSTEGKADNTGTIVSPWDIASAMGGVQEVRAGCL